MENQVGVLRRRFFVPRPRFKSYAELNAWLLDRCIAWAKAHPHPELRDKSIREVFEEERPSLVPYAGRFDGFHAVPAFVSKTVDVYVDRSLRQEPLLGRCLCRRPARRDPRLCRTGRVLAGRPNRRPASPRLRKQ